MLVERCLIQPGTRAVCIREIQKSLAQSVKQLIEGKIQSLGVGKHFDITKTEIKAPGDGLIIFQGMQDHTAESIKSLEGYDVALVEEAQSLSARSLQLLRPTIRKEMSELWFVWNPRSPEDPVDKIFRGSDALTEAEGALCVEVNWQDNPWFTGVLEQERLLDLQHSPDTYDHVWNGGYETISEAIIFRDRVSVEAFETPAYVDRFYYGADWGFANDPTVLVRCYIVDDVLYVDHESFGYHVELDDVGKQVFDEVPDSKRWPIKADNSQPAQISYMKRQGYNIAPADKWQGSVEDGVKHLKAFKRIVVHERCVRLAQEFRLYSYKVDKITGDILPIIVDKHNHGIDSLRYALDKFIQRGKGLRITSDLLQQFAQPTTGRRPMYGT